MKIGAVMFFTTDSMQPAPLGRALEERGFESLWVPEHTHIPSSRKSAYPASGGLVQAYYELMDPFLALNTAAAVTTKLRIGTGIALVTQRDPIVTAKMVSSIDRLSGGRFCSASAMAGTRRRSRTTAPNSRAGTNWRASGSRR
jgi:alkanesulfonate monooxygenase SsuD/methylene tetrahydromethanopterin reductase-like flavin-dependent oxidoreductase (luciferase family)